MRDDALEHGQSVLVLRRLLARIRDVMAGEGSAQMRLARIVSIIASDLATEVCSIYVRRAGDVLELFATQGLRPAAVHHTRLRIGEGLIGEIAAKGRPLALVDAHAHPSFAYRPETGEEAFHSLMGVPVLHGGRVVGVLAVQSAEPRSFDEEEIEALQTLAMVLAELVVGGTLIARDELQPTEGIATVPTRLEGARINAGIGVGYAVMHRHRFLIRNMVAEDINVEHERLRQAVSGMHGAIDDLLRSSGLGEQGETRGVFEAYRMIAEDTGWLRRIGEAINTGLTAEAAIQKVNDDIHSRMSQVADDYLRERVHDLEDLANRLLQHLLGPSETAPDVPPGEDFVLVARNLGPAQLLDYDRTRLRAVVLEEGSPNAHVAIIARTMDIPMLGQVREALRRIDSLDLLIVDADHAQVLVRPGEDVKQMFQQSIAARDMRKAAYATLRDFPAESRDGVRVSLNLNAGLLVDMQHLKETNADGVGLYRTEVPFMIRSDFPDVDAQRQLYRRVLDYAAGKPVVFRTLDVGGDKVLPYWDARRDENPAMGWRAIRVSSDRPAILRQQLRAMVQAASGRRLCVMFPMIAEVGEFLFARRLLDLELARELSRGRPPPAEVAVGAMLEVPALIYQLPELFAHVDFLSIGTNDLMQYLFASDRGNYRISERYDSLSPAPLRALRRVLEAAEVAGVPVGICGEMAGRPLDAIALLGLGFRNLSVAPPAFGALKAMIRSLDVGAAAAFTERALTMAQRGLRDEFRAFALDHGVRI